MSSTVQSKVVRGSGVVAFVAALAVAAAVFAPRVSPPARTSPQPPVALDAARSWLRARPGLRATPILGHPEWAQVAAAPDLALAWRHGLDPRDLSPAALVGVSAHRWPLAMLRDGARATRLDAEAVALLLDPPWADAFAARCPAPARLAPVCQGRARAAAAVDSWVLDTLSTGDPAWAWALLGAMPDLGTRGAAVASAILRDGAPSARARAVVALSWADPAGAPPTLRALLAEPGPLVPLVAALELGRLGHAAADPDLATLQSRLAGSGDAVLVAYARGLATGALPAPGPQGGL